MSHTSAETAYARACDHWQRCTTCSAAGGELDGALHWRNLCPLGKRLAQLWERAERAESVHATRQRTQAANLVTVKASAPKIRAHVAPAEQVEPHEMLGELVQATRPEIVQLGLF